MKYLILALLLNVSCTITRKLKVIPTPRPQEHFVMFANCSGYVELDGQAIVRELYCQPYNFTTGEIFGEMVEASEELVDGQQVAVIPLTELIRLRDHLRRGNYVAGVDPALDDFVEDVDILLETHADYPGEVFN